MKPVALIAATACVLGLSGQARAEMRLVVNCFWPPQHFVCQKVLPDWIEKVEEVTEGRVPGVVPTQSVASPPEQLASVEAGVVDVAVQFNGLIANRVVGPMVAMNPFISTNDTGAMSQALWETNRKYFPDEFATVQLLAQWVISPGELFSQTDAPINSIEDLQSRKIWALPGTLADVMKKIGAGVVATPAVKAMEIISNGVVDAHVGLDPHAVKAFQLIPYTKSMTQFSKKMYTTSFSLVMNKQKWEEISEADREAIMAVSGNEIGQQAAMLWQTSTVDALEAFEAAGIKIVDADPEFETQLIESSRFVAEAWIEAANNSGIDGKGAYDFYTQRVLELSGE
jgi:TRAP-type C4-dicarboxylate transport system substrate-binding protein